MDTNLSHWKDFLVKAPPDCNFGFYHGAIEAFARHDSNFSLTPSLIRDVCKRIQQKQLNTSIGSCVHAFGHMELLETKGDVSLAFDFCDTLSDFFPNECFHGVFMESLTKLNLADAGLANINGLEIKDRFELKEIEGFCAELSGRQQELCWREMSHAYLFETDFDAQKTFDSCARIPASKQIQSQCVLHGLQAFVSQKKDNLESLADVCLLKTAVPNFTSQCFRMLVHGILYTENALNLNPIKICGHAPDNFKESCYGGIGSALMSMGIRPDERKAYCAYVPDNYRALCIKNKNSI